VRDSRATIVHYLGVMPAMLLGAPASPADRDHRVRFGFGAGVDRRHQASFEARFGFPLLEAWAMTETGAGAVVIAHHEPRHVGQSCFGRAAPALELRLVDADAGQPEAHPRRGPATRDLGARAEVTASHAATRVQRARSAGNGRTSRASAPSAMVLALALISAVALTGCGGGDEAEPRRIDISFGAAGNDWTLGTSDYSVDTEGGEEYVVAVALDATAGGPFALTLDVSHPASSFRYQAKLPATFSVAVPGLGVDVGGFASAGLLTGGSVAARPQAEGGGYLLTLELALGLSVTGVSLGSLSRVSVGKVVVPIMAPTAAARAGASGTAGAAGGVLR
jgi:hypothetical protein